MNNEKLLLSIMRESREYRALKDALADAARQAARPAAMRVVKCVRRMMVSPSGRECGLGTVS